MTITQKQSDIFSVIEDRKSVKSYDSNAILTKEEVEELIQLTSKAPSAWNLQHWHFMVFHGKEVQEKLLPIAYNQKQVVDSSVVIAILGDLEADKNAEAIFSSDVEKGLMTQEIKDAIIGQIQGAYQNAQYARDAAFSNASLAAMQLMLAAKGKGLDTCPIGGFNVSKFVEEFNVSDRYVPVMLITVGTAAQPARPSDRLSIEQTTTWV